MTTPESKAVITLKGYQFPSSEQRAINAVLAELAACQSERDRLRTDLETAIRAYAAKGIKLTWAIEALKGDK